jgi:PAS domain S-box-containing protein
MRKLKPAILLNYALALAAVGAGWLLEWHMLGWPPLEIFPALLLAVMASAWKGGLGPGLLAAVLAGCVAPRIGNHVPEGVAIASWLAGDLARFAVYAMAGGLVGLLSSSRTHGESALRANQELFHRFIDAIPAAAYVKDDGGHYLYINRRMQRLFKASSPNCVGKTDFDLFPRDLAQRLRADDALVLSNGRELSTEQTLVQDQSPQQWLIHKFSFQSASGQRFLAGILVDITQSRSRPGDARPMVSPIDVRQLQSALERTLSKVDLPSAEATEQPAVERKH